MNTFFSPFQLVYACLSLVNVKDVVRSQAGIGIAGIMLVVLTVAAGLGICSVAGIIFTAATTQVFDMPSIYSFFDN